MKDGVVEQVRAIQASMVESGRSSSSESEMDDLRCLIRLTVEFYHYLQRVDIASLNEAELRYTCESVFSGTDSFCGVSAAFRMMTDETRSALA
jgi:hypothetical protein